MSKVPPHIKEERDTSPQPSRSGLDDQPHQRQRVVPTSQQSSQQSTTSKDREPMTGIVLPPISSLHTATPLPQPVERHRPGSIASITSPIYTPPPSNSRTTTSTRRITADQRWTPYDTARRSTTVQDSRRRSDSSSSLRSSAVQSTGPLLLKSVTAPPLLPSLPSSDYYPDRRASSGSGGLSSVLHSTYARPTDHHLNANRSPPDRGPRRPSAFHGQIYSRHASVVSSTSSISGTISSGTMHPPQPTHQLTPTRTAAPRQPPSILYASHQTSTSPPSDALSLHPNFAPQPSLQPPMSTISSRIPISIDTLHASYSADEKRKRNAGASARFRARRREREHISSQAIDELRQRLGEAEREAESLRRERDELLVVLDRGNRGAGREVVEGDTGVDAVGEGHLAGADVDEDEKVRGGRMGEMEEEVKDEDA